MEQALKTCFHFKCLCIKNNLRRHWFIFLVYRIFSLIFNVGGWGKKKFLHNAKVLNIACLISPMAWSFDICKVLKLNTYDQVNIERNMYKVVSKLYFKNNHEIIVTSVNKIYIKFMRKKIKYFYFKKMTSVDL